ncbi:kinase-like protein, partial [Saccharata proteae CBS 121410]
MWDRLSLHKLGGWLRKDEDGEILPSDLEKSPQEVDLSLDGDEEERVGEEQSKPPQSPRRSPRKVIPGLPRPTTFRRQKSEQRDRLVPVELPPAERRAASADRRGEPNASRNISPPPDFASRSSAPDSLDQYDAPKALFDFSGSRNSLLKYGNDDVESQPDRWLPPPPDPLSMNDELPPDDYASSEVDERMLQQEMDKKWILNLSMTFRDESQREKFFVTYAEQPNKWRRVTVSCDYRNTTPESLESDLKSLHYQRDKSARIYESIRDSLPAIQFYDTVTNLKLETSDGRLHVHVTEDMNEIISYPSISAIDHLQCPVVPESSVRFESHLSGFVYKVLVDGQIYIKKEIPGPKAVEEFLYETNTLSKLQGSSSVIEFRGVIVDDAREKIVGLLINYARYGALVDMMYDLKTTRQMPWPRRERWAKQIVQGLSDIHESGFVQGDFTLSNIVIDSNDDAKIIDINRRGCPVGWEPPELAKLIESGQRIGIYIGVKSDLFQLGMVLWALAEQADEPERQERPLMVTDVDAPQYFKDIVNSCLSDDPRGRLLSTHRSDKEYIDPDTAVGREDIDQFRVSRGAAPLDNPSTGELSFADVISPTEYQAGSSGSYILPNRGRSPAGSRHLSRYSSPPRPTSSISFDDSELSNEIVSPPVGLEPRWEHVHMDGVTRLVHHGSAAFDDHDFAAQEQATVCLPTPPGETADIFTLDRP